MCVSWRKGFAQALRERRAVKDFREHLLDIFDVHKADARFDALRYVFLDVGAIRCRCEYGLDTRAMRRKDLLFESADREHLPDKRDLARHGDVRVNRRLGEERDERGQQCGARAGALLADAAFRHVHVHVAVAQNHRGWVVRDAKSMRV